MPHGYAPVCRHWAETLMEFCEAQARPHGAARACYAHRGCGCQATQVCLLSAAWPEYSHLSHRLAEATRIAGAKPVSLAWETNAFVAFCRQVREHDRASGALDLLEVRTSQLHSLGLTNVAASSCPGAVHALVVLLAAYCWLAFPYTLGADAVAPR